MSRLIIIASACIVASVAHAAAIPDDFRGHSITLHWTEDRETRDIVEEQWGERRVERELELYISTEGRLFQREHALVYRRGKGHGGINTSKYDKIIENFSLQGHRLSLVAPMDEGSAARQVMIEFSSSLSECQANITIGKAEGTSSYKHRGSRGQAMETRSVKTSSASCTIEARNIFEH